MSTNLHGVFYGMAAAPEVMHRQGHGAIVNTASVGGIRGVGNQPGYAGQASFINDAVITIDGGQSYKY